MSPDVKLGLLLGAMFCVTGAVIIGLLARDSYLRRQKRREKARAKVRTRRRPIAQTAVFSRAEVAGLTQQAVAEAETVLQLRHKDYANTATVERRPVERWSR